MMGLQDYRMIGLQDDGVKRLGGLGGLGGLGRLGRLGRLVQIDCLLVLHITMQKHIPSLMLVSIH